jgi:hypothetical protein
MIATLWRWTLERKRDAAPMAHSLMIADALALDYTGPNSA